MRVRPGFGHQAMNRLSSVLAALRGGGAPAPAPAATATDTEVVDGYRAQSFADMLPELSAPGATPERLQYLHEHGVKPTRQLMNVPSVRLIVPLFRSSLS